MPNRKIRIRLKELLYDRKLSQTELSRRTGIREATISHMCNNLFESVHFGNLSKIMVELQVDFNDILEIVELKEEEE